MALLMGAPLRRTSLCGFQNAPTGLLQAALTSALIGLLGGFPPSGAFAASFDFSLYDGLLRSHVRDGRVDYAALKARPDSLTAFLEQIGQVDPGEAGGWPENERKAFWINAYNAITIEGIIRNYPIRPGGVLARLRFPDNSIRQIGGFWDTKFVPVMGGEITLDEIEHEILRAQFGDPRIHFVIVCASLGCPKLRGEAFTGENLDLQLDDAARALINDTTKVRLDQKENRLYLSSIFDWYKDDFVASAQADGELREYGRGVRGVVDFVTRFLPQEQSAFIRTRHPKIEYLGYDWSLNDRR